MNRFGVGGFDARSNNFLGDNWPSELGAEYRDFTVHFQGRTHQVLLKILQALALGLGWEENFFDEVSTRLGNHQAVSASWGPGMPLKRPCRSKPKLLQKVCGKLPCSIATCNGAQALLTKLYLYKCLSICMSLFTLMLPQANGPTALKSKLLEKLHKMHMHITCAVPQSCALNLK